MKVKVILAGETVDIPKAGIGPGAALISVWTDSIGFTSASNDLGSLGYILLETPEIDVEIDAERQSIFAQLHGLVVHWNIKANTFMKDGGTARISMRVSVEQDGGIVDKEVEFEADNCTGVCVVSKALEFSCEMLQIEKTLADLGANQIIPDDVVVAAAGAAPTAGNDDQQSVASQATA